MLAIMLLVALPRDAHAGAILSGCAEDAGQHPAFIVDTSNVAGMEASGLGRLDLAATRAERRILLSHVSFLDERGQSVALQAAQWNGWAWIVKPAAALTAPQTYTLQLAEGSTVIERCTVTVSQDRPGTPVEWLGGDAAWIGRPRGAPPSLYVMIATPDGARSSDLWLAEWMIQPDDREVGDRRGPDFEYRIPRTSDSILTFRIQSGVIGHRWETIRLRVRNSSGEFSASCFDIELFVPSLSKARPVLSEVTAVNPIDRFVVGDFERPDASDLLPEQSWTYGSKSSLGFPLRAVDCPTSPVAGPPGPSFE